MSALAALQTYKRGSVQAEGHTLGVLAFHPERDGLPLVFIHGITSNIDFWTLGQTPYIHAERGWYALSLAGHAPATFPAGFSAQQLTAEHIADVTISALRQLLGDAPFLLVGHSTGGWLALNVAARLHRQVRGVVSVSGFAHGRWTGALGLNQRLARGGALSRALFKASYRLLAAQPQLLNLSLRLYLAQPQALYSAPNFHEIAANTRDGLRALDLDAMLSWFSRMPDIDILPQLKALEMPVLLMHGDQDPIVPYAEAQRIVAAVPSARLVTLTGAGHIPMIERTEVYHSTLTTWLQSI